MKLFALALVTLISSNAFAATTKLDSSQRSSVREAINLVMPNEMDCGAQTPHEQNIRFSNISAVIRQANEAEMTDGSQPLVTFTYSGPRAPNEKWTVEITTNQDFTKIASAVVRTFAAKRINFGNIAKPDIRGVYEQSSAYSCVTK